MMKTQIVYEVMLANAQTYCVHDIYDLFISITLYAKAIYWKTVGAKLYG